MKLVETDVPVAEDDVELPEPVPTPPRPEHRRVSVSLILTVGVLVATVVTVYLVIPERHNQLMTDALEEFEAPGEEELSEPTAAELQAWSTALLGKGVPWPSGPEVEILSARSEDILNRPAALVRFRIAGDEVVVVAQRPREAVARTYHRATEGATISSWRRGSWTFVAVGPAATAERWKAHLNAP